MAVPATGLAASTEYETHVAWCFWAPHPQVSPEMWDVCKHFYIRFPAGPADAYRHGDHPLPRLLVTLAVRISDDRVRLVLDTLETHPSRPEQIVWGCWGGAKGCPIPFGDEPWWPLCDADVEYVSAYPPPSPLRLP